MSSKISSSHYIRPRIKVVQGKTLIPLLGFILLFSLLNQWIRWLPVYLSSITESECDKVCNDIPFTPLCKKCEGYTSENSPNSHITSYQYAFSQTYIENPIDNIHEADITSLLSSSSSSLTSPAIVVSETKASCEACHTCRQELDSEVYNFMDGICMTTKQYAMVTGLGFSLSFGAFGLIAGLLVDFKSDRGSTILGMSCLFCGLITILMSFADNFFHVLLLRSMLGAVQAFGAPSTVYLITSHFSTSSDRVIANAAYTIGVYLGAGLSSLSTIAGAHSGWRPVLAAVGYITIVSAAMYEIIVDIGIHICYSIPSSLASSNQHRYTSSYAPRHERRPLLYDPTADDIDDEESGDKDQMPIDMSNMTMKVSYKALENMLSDEYIPSSSSSSTSSSSSSTIAPPQADVLIPTIDIAIDHHYEGVIKSLQELLTGGPMPMAMPLLLLASGLRFMAGIAIFVYFPVLMTRKYPKHEDLFSIFNALILLICGSTSSVLGGRYGHDAVKRDGLPGIIHLTAMSVIACMLPFTIAIIADSFYIHMIALAGGYLLGEAWMGLSLAALQSISHKHMQGLSMASYLFFNWITAAIAVELIGWMDPGTEALSTLLAAFVLGFMLMSSFCFLALERLYRRYDQMQVNMSKHENLGLDEDIK